MWRDPGCGCCLEWAKRVEAAFGQEAAGRQRAQHAGGEEGAGRAGGASLLPHRAHPGRGGRRPCAARGHQAADRLRSGRASGAWRCRACRPGRRAWMSATTIGSATRCSPFDFGAGAAPSSRPTAEPGMTDTPASMTYGGYLSLDQLLSAQHPISNHHDEMLFVIIHQTKELWLKQTVHELKLSREMIRQDRLIEVHKALSRVSRIQAVMTLSWDVLATMTPSDYTSFRAVLGSSSGFQSAQFREFEYRLGSEGRRPSQIPGGRHRPLSGPARGPSSAEPVGRGQCRRRPGRDRASGRGARTGLEPALPAERGGGGRLGRGLSRSGASLGALPARRETGRHRRFARRPGATSMW